MDPCTQINSIAIEEDARVNCSMIVDVLSQQLHTICGALYSSQNLLNTKTIVQTVVGFSTHQHRSRRTANLPTPLLFPCIPIPVFVE
jgi:hypothetical protein